MTMFQRIVVLTLTVCLLLAINQNDNHKVHAFLLGSNSLSRPRRPFVTTTTTTSSPSRLGRASFPMLAKMKNKRSFKGSKKMTSQPRVIVFDLDGCLWAPEMYELAWSGGGRNHAPFTPGNKGLYMKSAQGNVVRLIGDVAEILDSIALGDDDDNPFQSTVFAISSRCDEPDWARELLSKFRLPQSGKTLEEVITGPWEISYDSKVHHFERIAKKTKVPLDEMIFFDNELGNCRSLGQVGVTVGYSPRGVNWSIWERTMKAFPSSRGKVIGL